VRRTISLPATRVSMDAPTGFGAIHHMMSRMPRRVLVAACSAVCASFSCLAVQASPSVSRAAAATAPLRVWIGHWHTRGESGGTPWHADTRCAWSANHGFVVCDQLINDSVNQLMILSYDEAARAYRISSIGKDRAPIISFGTVHGGVWTNVGNWDQGGKRFMIKTTVDFSVPHRYSDREMISEDGGAHWAEESRGHSVQVR
jgi:hypothetical protein